MTASTERQTAWSDRLTALRAEMLARTRKASRRRTANLLQPPTNRTPDTGHRTLIFLLGAALGFASSAGAQSGHQVQLPLGVNGEVPAWLVAGPFELGIEGFGQPREHDDPIGETTASPVEEQTEQSKLVLGGQVQWEPFSSGNNGYMDFMEAAGWSHPSDEPRKIWWARVAYAFAIVESDRERDLTLQTGSNSALKVVLNGEVVYKWGGDRDAHADDDSIAVRLIEGPNRLLVRVGQTHRNEGPSFFGGLAWQWGFFARFTEQDGSHPNGLTIAVPTVEAGIDDPTLTSTFFFRHRGGELLQRFDLRLRSSAVDPLPGEASIETAAGTTTHELASIPFGVSRHEIWLPASEKDRQAGLVVQVGDASTFAGITLEAQPHYEIHLAMMSHTDIGYTHIQPVVKERHLRWLDDVVKRCDEDSTFKWTIETMWQLEQYRLGRPESDFDRLLGYIRAGRIAVSPIYTNPFTGWISDEEMVRSFDFANEYSEQYGLQFEAAVYNDVPGLSWVAPQVLNDNGIDFLATGINEVYGGYSLQRNLPKSWIWEGPGGGRVVTYRNDAYNEGQAFGLEKDTTAVKFKLWERLNRLRAQGHDRDLLLALHTFGDNGPIPLKAGPVAKQWNEGYAWPRFRISTIDDFASAFTERYADSLPTLRGDWTSTWDVRYQGEPDRMIRQRWSQNNLPTAEKMATIAWLRDPSQQPLSAITESAYANLLRFSGHGSGLEFGYGSPRDNLLAMAYREQYVQAALLETTEVMERALVKLSTPEESFEGEALYVFNPLNWTRDAPIEFEFPRESRHAYRPVDLETRAAIPYDFTGYTLRFVARNVPPLGFKKVRLHRTEAGETDRSETDLSIDGCTIENSYYRIEADCETGIQAVIDRRNGRQIAGSRFGDPVRADSLMSRQFTDLDRGVRHIKVVDQRPARLVLAVDRENHLFKTSTFELWENTDAIGIDQTLDLQMLEKTDHIQEYATRFEFDVEAESTLVDVAGGLLDPATDRLPGVDHDLFAVRRGLSLSGRDYAVDWVSIDGRVIRLRSGPDGNPVVLSNLVNNFPENWNRWEPNDTTIHYRFAIRGRSPDRSGTWDYTRFAWEASAPTVAHYTWLRSEPASGSFLSVDGDVVLSSMRRDGEDLEIRLVNPDTRNPAEAAITTDFAITELTDASADGSDTLRVRLAPGEIATVRLAAHP